MSHDFDALAEWIGETEEVVDQLTPWPAQALAATLDASQIHFQSGNVMPPLWHWLYFKQLAPSSSIGHDGHPAKGGFLPPIALPRRMWAGGRLSWNTGNPLRIGQSATRHSRIAAITPKNGRSGPMVFVTLVHEIRNPQGLCLTEEQDIVYREESKGTSASTPPIQATKEGLSPCWQHRYLPDEVMLFRYSALTFNSHRIHYDRPYAVQVEGYPGLVVHGPLIATLLAELVRREQPPLVIHQFSFRAMAPAFDDRPLEIAGLGNESRAQLWAEDKSGRRLMQAEAQFAKGLEVEKNP